MRVLTIDVGSSSVKAAFWDGSRFRSRVRVGYETRFDGASAELDPATVTRAVMRAGKQAGGNRAEAISFCTLSSGVVVTDANGRPRTPIITHQDRRSIEQARALTKHLGKPWLLQHTANLPYPGGIGSSTLAWLRQKQPTALRGKARIGQLSTLIGFLLTGEWTIDPSQAVFLGLWDIKKWQWNERICDAVGISPESLPRCLWADEPIGRLTPDIARAWGIHEGIPVLGGFVDTSAAVLQTPMRPGQLAHGAGSTDVLAMCVETPQPAEGLLTRPVGVRGANRPAPWLAVLTIASAGSSLGWARHQLFRDLADPAWKKTLARLCDAITPASLRASLQDPALPQCIPDFSGNRAAIDQPPGAAYSHLRLSTTREDLLSALLRALVRQSATHYTILSRVHRPARTVYSIGGASDLAARMHAAWKGRHAFKALPGDSLAGLVTLAEHYANR